jgi:hypothetical protein
MHGTIQKCLAAATLVMGASVLASPANAARAAESFCPSSIGNYAFQYECGEDLPGTACYWYHFGEPQYVMFDCTTEQPVGDCDASSCRMT